MGDDVVLFAPNGTSFTEFRLMNGQVSQSVVETLDPGYADLVVQKPVLENLVVLHSSTAGSNLDLYESILAPLLRFFGITHRYIRTTSPDTIAEVAASLSDSPDDSIIAVLGGDTSVHELVNNLPELSTSSKTLRIAVIPAGSGNALATSVGLISPVLAIRSLFKNHFKPLSTFQLTFPSSDLKVYAVVVASWGFHASLVADSEALRPQFRENPTDRFKEAARRLMQDVKQEYYGNAYTLPRKSSLFGTHSYLLFTTVTKLESNFCISPRSNPPSDDCLHMVAIPPLADQERELGEIMGEVYQDGQHINDPRVTYRRIDTELGVQVASQPDSMRRWCIDGHIIVCEPGEVVISRPSHACRGWNLMTLSQ